MTVGAILYGCPQSFMVALIISGTFLNLIIVLKMLIYLRLLQNPRFHHWLLTFNPYGVDIVKRITPLASCFYPR